MKKQVRVAALQYFIRPVNSFDQFAEQVRGLVSTAADYKVDLLVFPEYFTLQLLTLHDSRRPISELIRELAEYRDRVVELLQSLASEKYIYIVGGSMPSFELKLDGKPANISYLFGPSGTVAVQPKLHMTRFEKEEWLMAAGKTLRIFDTEIGKIAVNICYDVEFPELAREAARNGASILVVPSCTDDRQGFLRVRYCAQSRTIENQMYVIHAVTVGSLPMIPAVSLNYGQASILTPSDFQFARDGIKAEGVPNQEGIIIGDVDLDLIESSRDAGTVLPLRDSEGTREAISKVEVMSV